MYVCIYIHIYIYTHIHIYTYTYQFTMIIRTVTMYIICRSPERSLQRHTGVCETKTLKTIGHVEILVVCSPILFSRVFSFSTDTCMISVTDPGGVEQGPPTKCQPPTNLAMMILMIILIIHSINNIHYQPHD